MGSSKLGSSSLRSSSLFAPTFEMTGRVAAGLLDAATGAALGTALGARPMRAPGGATDKRIEAPMIKGRPTRLASAWARTTPESEHSSVMASAA